MKKQLLVFIFAVFCSMAWGQNVTTTPTIIASSGHYSNTAGLEVSYTIGEMTAVTTAGNTNGLHLTQGFHQPEEVVSPIALPTVSTLATSFITNNSAVSGGDVTSDGGAFVTARGVCYATHITPTTADDTIPSGLDTGTYNVNILNLTPNTTYHVRAYAINSVGTAYGNEYSFTTTNLTGLNNVSISKSFTLNPNPATNTIWANYEMTEPGKAQITITDVTGKELQTTEDNYTSGKAMKSFDVSKISAGNYLLQLNFTSTTGKHYSSTKQFSINH